MIIGGSPAGSAGGIKTVTLGVVFASMLSALRGRSDTEAFGRALPLDLLQKALTVIMTMLIVVLAGSIILRITEPGVAFTDLLFEVCSAAGTVGVSAGLTPSLSVAGKLVITLCMFLGRLSPVTLVVALNLKMKANTDSIKRPNERVIIG
jgi:trk system potassium uptake protein TrkH